MIRYSSKEQNLKVYIHTCTYVRTSLEMQLLVVDVADTVVSSSEGYGSVKIQYFTIQLSLLQCTCNTKLKLKRNGH